MPVAARIWRASNTMSATPPARNGTMSSVSTQSGSPAAKRRIAITTKNTTIAFHVTQAAATENNFQPGAVDMGNR